MNFPAFSLLARWILSVGVVVVFSGRGRAAESVIRAEVFDPGYVEGDSNYHCLTAASNGKLYFGINSHQPAASVRLYRFDPQTELMALVADVSEALGLDPAEEIVHGKIHTPLIEFEDALYFATHTSQYDGNLPMMAPSDGRRPYPGGHFMRMDLGTETLEDIAQLSLPNEGIITMALDPVQKTLYGLTWPTGLLISYNLEEGLLHNWGAVHDRGEWGPIGTEWDFICRRLGTDGDGTIYGSTNTGKIWRFERGAQRPVDFYAQLDLDAVPALQSETFKIEPEAHYFWRNWRTIVWNEQTDSFWGLHGGSSQLFEFSPQAGTLRSVRTMIPDGLASGRRNAMRTQLGFMLGPQNTLFYLAHGSPTEVADRRPVKASVHLLTYEIDTDTFKDHGPIVGPEGQRIFFTESIEIGADGRIYSLAWVETVDEDRMALVQRARGLAVPEETEDAVYEMQLVRLPQWDSFIHQ